MPLKRGAERIRQGALNVQVRRCLVFSVDRTEYGIPVRHVKMSMPVPPRGESSVTVHGERFPVVDAREVLGLSPATATDRVLLAVEGAHGRAGLVVDRIVSLTSIAERAIVPLPTVFAGAERDWLEGLAPLESRVLALVRTDGLVGLRGQPASSACVAGPPADR
jgi:purine-binding chemotaxis protein CheW